jgi:hypothetical protein
MFVAGFVALTGGADKEAFAEARIKYVQAPPLSC